MNTYLLSLYLVLAYLIGNIMGGYIIGLFYHINISKEGSGNVGSRNAGRILGKRAFIITALIDGSKGLIVVLLGRFWHMSTTFILLAILLVIVGHVLPIIFNFKGGQGIATLIGAMLAFNWWFALIIIACILLLSKVLNSFTWGFYTTIIIYAIAQLFINYLILPDRIIIFIILLFILIKSELDSIVKKWHNLIN